MAKTGTICCPSCEFKGGTRQALVAHQRIHRDGKDRPGARDPLPDQLATHHTAQARELALEKAREELEDARGRAAEAAAEVRVLERLVGRLGG